MKTLVLGNIITMNEEQLTAEALVVENGVIQYVGSKRGAVLFAGADAQVMDYGDNYIYPGFMEAHAHGSVFGVRSLLQFDISKGTSVEEYVQLVADYIEKNPGRETYKGYGWEARPGENPTAKALDELGDVPIYLSSIDGHSMWMNSAAMKVQKVDAEYANSLDHDVVPVDENGNPTGCVNESSAFEIANRVSPNVEECRAAILAWEKHAFAHGYTAAVDAGIDFAFPDVVPAYLELAAEDALKLTTFAMVQAGLPGADADDAVDYVSSLKAHNTDHFKVVAVKIFLDGVVEAHTAWLDEEYSDQPGYFGNKRFSDHAKLARVIQRANQNGLYVHMHSIGDGATRFALDAIQEAQEETGIKDARNSLAHLQVVRPEDIKRMGELGVIATVAPLWTPVNDASYVVDCEALGPERLKDIYPIKSFLDAGVCIAFHTDCPVSLDMSIPRAISEAQTRHYPGKPETTNNAAECITSYEALKALTVNVAYQMGVSDRMGSLEVGKVANLSVFDKDFLNGDAEEVADANLVATIVDGAVVYGR